MPPTSNPELHLPKPSDVEGSVHHTSAHDHHTSTRAQLNQIYAGAVSGALTRTLTQPFDVLKIRFQLQVEPLTIGKKSKYNSLWQASKLIYHEEGVRGLFKGHNAGQFMSIVYSVGQFWSYEQIRAVMRDMPFMSTHMNVMNFLAGGFAGCVATIFSIPFDVIRTRLVAQDPGQGYRNMLHAVPLIWRTEGVRGYFRGLQPTLVQIVPLVGFNFMFYKKFNEMLVHTRLARNDLLPTWVLLCTGGAAGVASKAVVYPLDFIKKRLQVQGFEQHRTKFGRTQRCKGVFHCIELTMREEGIMGFYKGIYPTLIKSGLMTAFYFTIYDRCKLLLHRYYNLNDGHAHHPTKP
ncbi:mitochondrial thiamine pyrophosphate carrier-like [Anastrepha ludens]|uniref:mitochondrial thiamine pyrophosphate carrier-like n=1 Tax=Anastrepha ludens TaxID=28586 RepID=UPI0023AE703D|nr:mitochondrial thiamine pyrophosphate carrier-like [Anastrepha ludens]